MLMLRKSRARRLRETAESEKLAMAVLTVRNQTDQDIDLLERSGNYYLRRHRAFSEREYREHMVAAIAGIKQRVTDALVFAAYVDALGRQKEYEAFEARFRAHLLAWMKGKVEQAQAEQQAMKGPPTKRERRELERERSMKEADMTAGEETADAGDPLPN